ncbi:VOC family protein [Paenibacillus peoriae]|uniref:VOC family protein n=1 Tax=Paenibacillus peoriae TaxID=59893 RepID=UPI003F97C381
MKEIHFFGSTAKFHHVGLAVSRIELAEIENLEVFADPIQQVNVGFINLGGSHIELIEPNSEHSPVSNSIKKGTKLVHLCFEVDNIEQGLQSAVSYQFKVLQQPTPAVAFNNRKIAWVYHSFWGLFELLERDTIDRTHSI